MQTQNLQIIPRGVKPIIKASQFDVGREFELKLYDGAVAYTPPAGTTLRLDGVKPDGTVFSYTENLSLSGSTITVTTTTQMTILEGTVQCEIRMTKDNDDIGTINFDLMVEKSPINETTDLSQTEVPALVTLARTQMENAEAWAVGTKDGEPVSQDDPQYNNSAKYWAQQAGSLSGLKDVALTSLAAGQSLVYDATEQKWVNGSISASNVNYTNETSGLTATKVQAAIDEVAAENQTLTNNVKARAELSAYNLLNIFNSEINTSGTYTEVINDDGTVTIGGTPTSACTIPYKATAKYNGSLYNLKPSTDYVLDSGLSAISPLNLQVFVKENSSSSWTKIAEATADTKLAFTTPASFYDIWVRILVPANAVVTTSTIVKPMIILASDITIGFVPYAMTNRELTDAIANSYVFMGMEKRTVTADGVKTYKELIEELRDTVNSYVTSLGSDYYIITRTIEIWSIQYNAILPKMTRGLYDCRYRGFYFDGANAAHIRECYPSKSTITYLKDITFTTTPTILINDMTANAPDNGATIVANFEVYKKV